MTYGSKMARREKGGEDERERETNESGSKDTEKLVKDNGMAKRGKEPKMDLIYQEGAVTRTVEPFQKSKNKNEFGY